MRYSRCLLLAVLVACGSKHAPEPQPPGSGSGVQPGKAPEQPIAIAFVFEGWEMWVGNDRLDDIAEHERYPGVLRSFEDAFARVPLNDAPAGSRAAVVTYTDRATVRYPLGAIDKLAPAAFGEQKDYVNTIDRNLVAGVTAGLDELKQAGDARRVLVVIGDGTDTNTGTAKPALAALARRAAAEHVEIVSLLYAARLSPDARVIGALDPSPLQVNTIDGLVDQLGWLFARLKPRPVSTGKVPLALVVLMSGWELWIGNDDLTPEEDPSRYVGAFKSVRAALEQAPLTGFPAGAQGMVITYADHVQVRVPMSPIESIDGHTIGTQKDYYGTTGLELVSGVTTAFTELSKVDAARRVLVILGDGGDTNNDAAKTQLRALAKRAAEQHIEVHAIVYKTQLSGEATVVTELDPKAAIAPSATDITTQLIALFAQLRKHGP